MRSCCMRLFTLADLEERGYNSRTYEVVKRPHTMSVRAQCTLFVSTGPRRGSKHKKNRRSKERDALVGRRIEVHTRIDIKNTFIFVIFPTLPRATPQCSFVMGVPNCCTYVEVPTPKYGNHAHTPVQTNSLYAASIWHSVIPKS